MIVIRLLVVVLALGSEVRGQCTGQSVFLAPRGGPDAKVQDAYLSELRCLKRLDDQLKKRWSTELSSIDVSDLNEVSKTPWKLKDSSFAKYSTYQEEWLLNDRVPMKRMDTCSRNLIVDVVSSLAKEEVQCLNDLYANHMREESRHQTSFENYLNATANEQAVFRLFINFPDVTDVIFQNRNIDSLTDLERILYEHSFSYLATDADRFERTYVTTLECDWKNAKKLREAPSMDARFKEFESQVRYTASKQVAAGLLKKWNLDETLSAARYDGWLRARQKLETTLKTEVRKLQNERRDAQWLCEYATRIAFNSSDEQLAELLNDSRDDAEVRLDIMEITSQARALEKAIGQIPNDPRYRTIAKLANRYDEQTMCLNSFLSLIRNHRRYEIASLFVDHRFTYPEMFCKVENRNFGLVQVTFCNCIGSICGVAHPLAALFSEEYNLVEDADGKFKTVRSGPLSTRKIVHCHTLANPKRPILLGMTEKN